MDVELRAISSARGTQRADLVGGFVRDHVLTELRQHREALIKAGVYDVASLHPMVVNCLESFYQGQCLECGASQEQADVAVDSDVDSEDSLSCLLHAPVGRAPTKAGRNQLIFDAVQTYVLGGSSVASATRQVSDQVRSGEVEGIEQQVLATRTVLNIYRNTLNVVKAED